MRHVCGKTFCIRSCTLYCIARSTTHQCYQRGRWTAFTSNAGNARYVCDTPKKGDFNNLKVVIVGDIIHSRVARSQIHALNILGAREIVAVGPRTLLPDSVRELGVQIEHNFDRALEGTDVIMGLRLQKERMRSALLSSEDEYYRSYGLTEHRLRLAKPDAIVMHPGPTNRGVEIEASVADGPQSIILEQVTGGIAVRMAIMSIAMGNVEESLVNTRS